MPVRLLYIGYHGGINAFTGMLFELSGYHSNAEKHFRQAVRRNPNADIAHNLLGCCLGRKNRFRDAEEHYREAVRCDPGQSLHHSNLGTMLHFRNDYDGAEIHFREAIRCDPDNPSALKGLEVVLQGRDELAGYIEAVQQNPDDATSHKKLAKLARCSSVRETHLREVVRCDPTSASAHFALASCLSGAKENYENEEAQRYYDGAEAHFREAIRCNPNLLSAHVSLGEIRRHWKKDVPAAAEAYRAALLCDPDCAAAHFGIGMLLFSRARGDTSLGEAGLGGGAVLSSGPFYAAAAAKFREAIRCNPDHHNAHAFLGKILDHRYEDYAGAEEAYRTCTRLFPMSWTNRYLSTLLAMRLDFRGATAAYWAFARSDAKGMLQHAGVALLLVLAAGTEMASLFWQFRS
jgi:tetratricopeptide (TPR) repeat protein